jgi:hypothetical protein
VFIRVARSGDVVEPEEEETSGGGKRS